MEQKYQLQEERQATPRMDGRKKLWEFMGITMLEPSKKAGKDPCKNCWAKDLCDKDECGRKLYPLFVNKVK